jgi:tetratricopeptide (TPR) repeat protein
LSQSQHYGGALCSLDIAISYNPKNVKAYVERTYLHRHQGNYTLALADCNKGIDIAPYYARAYVSRGQTLYYLGDYRKALDDWATAIRLDPDMSNVLSIWIEAALKNR